jgi:lipid II:glycine glycyltransferase (peptidoglycan interpeptide bridge formation enzyme)
LKDLDAGYSADFNIFNKNAWHEIMHRFHDANLYQTPSYDMVRSSRAGITHMILKKADNIAAAAQIRIIQLPIIKTGIAYVFWGPMWRRPDVAEDVEVFRQALRALRGEFSLRRGLVLRVYPLAFQGKDDVLKQIFVDEGFRFHNDGKSHRTLILNLEPSLKEIRAALDQKWRNCLNRAEKNGLEIIQGENESLFDEINKIYLEMANRKGLADLSDIEHLRKVQQDLPEDHKLKVIICRFNGEICCVGIFSAIGSTALYLVGATSNAGMKSNGSYLVQWAFLEWIKESGLRYYDLNGINPVTNPGTYHFKRGLAGKQGIDVDFLGKYQVADNPISSLIVNSGELFVSKYKRFYKKADR